jgi:hypothetical protein
MGEEHRIKQGRRRKKERDQQVEKEVRAEDMKYITFC